MKNLRLAHPKLLDVAVPANLRCGQPENEAGLAAEPDWAPLRYSFAGVWEIDPHGLEEHVGDVQILDVREPDEFTGPLGHINGAVLIPLGDLGDRAGELAKDKPIVAVCRAGSRSAQATVDFAAGRVHRNRQFDRRHAALARRRPPGRRRQRVVQEPQSRRKSGSIGPPLRCWASAPGSEPIVIAASQRAHGSRLSPGLRRGALSNPRLSLRRSAAARCRRPRTGRPSARRRCATRAARSPAPSVRAVARACPRPRSRGSGAPLA